LWLAKRLQQGEEKSRYFFKPKKGLRVRIPSGPQLQRFSPNIGKNVTVGCKATNGFIQIKAASNTARSSFFLFDW
jgi:hypothetical protein